MGIMIDDLHRFIYSLLKWAGGKTQLLPEIQTPIPNQFTTEPFTYIEPFVRSGAVLFWMLNSYPTIKKAVINDKNQDLINTYLHYNL